MSDPSKNSTPSERAHADDMQIRAWLKLRQELAELHARLEYLKLILSLGVRQLNS